MSRTLLATVCLLSWTALAEAGGPDPELNQPYHLQVVLHIAGNRQLTRAFKDQVERELRANLRAALGDLAEVEVVHQNPHLAEAEASGLQSGLSGWKEMEDRKTHFVLIDFENDQYVIRARQHDGLTGLASPVVREARVSERQLVSRAATLLVDQDFGFVGTLTKQLGDQVDIGLKGGAIQDLGRWVKKGDIFQVAVINTAGQVFPVEWTLFRVTREPKDGVCECRVLFRFKDPFPKGQGGVRGYRCLRLTTTKAPVRLRFVEKDTRRPLSGLEIVVNQNGFTGDPLESLSTEAGGYVQTGRAYENVAFVRVVGSGNQTLVRLPVAIVDDRPVECLVSRDALNENLSELEWRRDRWVRQLYERLQLLQLLAKDLKDLLDKQAYQSAKERAAAGMDELKGEIKSLQDEAGFLKEAARERKLEGKLDLGEGTRLIQELKKGQERLAAHITAIDEAIKDQSNPERQKLQTLLHQAKLDEERADYDQALAKYDEALKGMIPVGEAIKKHIEELRRRWEPRDDEHRAARQFIYQSWPAAKTAKEMDEQMAEAQKALAKCKAVGDTLAPRKLFNETVNHVNELDQELSALKAEGNEDNQKKIEKIGDVAAKLKKLLEETTKYLQDTQPSRAAK